MLLFLQLYSAHLVADFLLQPDWIAKNKRRPSVLAAHAAIHFGVACAAVNVGLNRRILGAVALLAVVHIVSDYIKATLSRDTWVAFTVDQAMHLVAVGIMSLWLAATSWSGLVTTMTSAAHNKDFYLFIAAYVAVIFGGGYFVQKK